MEEQTYTHAEVSRKTAWTPDGLRDLRLKGYIDNYGQQGDNGRWTYSGRDIIAFWCADSLHKGNRRVDLKELFEKAWIISDLVAKHAAGIGAPRFWGMGEYRRKSWVQDIGGALKNVTSLPQPVRFKADTLAQIEDLDLWKMDIVDVEAMVSFLPETLRAVAAKIDFTSKDEV